ncbi:MAG TPA: esterase, partial [Arthrobacter sp.]
MDILEDLRLVDGPVLWIAWAAGAVGLAYLLWHGGRRRNASTAAARRPDLMLPAAAVLAAAALLAAVHWLMIYVFSVFPEELPREVLAWSLLPITALLLWAMRVWGIWRPGGDRAPGQGSPRHDARATAVATAAL